MKKLLLSFGLACFILAACKKDPVSSGPYFPQVKTIIKNNCLSCHTSGGVGLPALDTDDAIATNHASIKASVIDPATPLNKRMPQTGELTQADKDIIQKWFDKGGKTTD
jgi:uncharacterized membrane protein